VLDQRRLPAEEVWLALDDVEGVAHAIESLAVRGAPAIGCVAALGLAVAARGFPDDPAGFRVALASALQRLARTRPTAVNLFVALDQLAAAAATSPTDATPTTTSPRATRSAASARRCSPIAARSSPTATPARWRPPATAPRSG
jgi:methylthioribose-1-phosphate isomerase